MCFECSDFECAEQKFGKGVTCQKEDPAAENYGDSCYVAHTGDY